jgi:hypothetical protein
MSEQIHARRERGSGGFPTGRRDGMRRPTPQHPTPVLICCSTLPCHRKGNSWIGAISRQAAEAFVHCLHHGVPGFSSVGVPPTINFVVGNRVPRPGHFNCPTLVEAEGCVVSDRTGRAKRVADAVRKMDLGIRSRAVGVRGRDRSSCRPFIGCTLYFHCEFSSVLPTYAHGVAVATGVNGAVRAVAVSASACAARERLSRRQELLESAGDRALVTAQGAGRARAAAKASMAASRP